MRTAIISSLRAGLCVLSACSLTPSRFASAFQAPVQQAKPSRENQARPIVAPPTDVDPTKMAAPPSNGNAKPPHVAPVDTKSYILGAEDQILITVWRSPEFSGSHMIRPDGKITLNLIGEVEAAGLTPEALGSSIQERLKKVLREPDVSVSVTEVKSKRYFIEGEILKPGEYKLVVPTHVLEALVNAGGFKDFAKQTDITIIRGAKRLKFNYKNAIKGKNLDQNVLLEPGDIIIVK